MPLKLIIGRSHLGKSRLMYEDVKYAESNNKKCIVFVPSFARIVAEEEYFKYTENSGMINTKITTLERFAMQNIDKKSLYGKKDFLPEMSKKYIIKKCILDNESEFKIFSKVKNTQGFADKLYKFVNIFESEDINEEDLDKLFSTNNFLSQKFKEIYDLYKIIESKTKERFVTSFEVIDFFTNQILESGQFGSNTDYFFDYYNNFNKKELEFIRALISKELNVTITLDLDMKNKELSDIFDISYDTYQKLKRIALEFGCKTDEIILDSNDKAQNTLEALQKNIFVLGSKKYEKNDGTVKVKLLKNPYDEVEYIAQDIITTIKNKKARYKDFKIYYNNPDMYDTVIKRIFNEYDIPVYINSECSGKSDTLVVFLSNLMLQTVTGFLGISTENVIQILKTGLNNFDEQDIYMFENYVSEFGIKLYNFTKKFEKNNKEDIPQSIVYDLEKINNIREFIYNSVTNLKESLNKSENTRQVASVIYDYLHESGVLQKYEKQLNEIKNYDVDEFNKKKQTVQYIYEIMDDIALAFDTLDTQTYSELFIYGLENINLKSIPPFIDQVEVCNIDSTRSLSRKNVYIIGTYENGLPIISNSESMFSDKEILELKSMNIEIAKTSENRNNMALFNVYKAINSCDGNLIFTIPASKLTGESLRVSPVIWRIKDAIKVEVDGDISEKKSEKLLCIKNIYDQFVEEINNPDKYDIHDIVLNYKLLMDDNKYSKVLTYTREDAKLCENTINKLYGKDIFSSISRLERYNACPFSYFTNYVLKLREKKEYKLSVLDLGSIMHKVLEEFSLFLLQNNKGFEDIISDDNTLNLARNQIDKSIDDIFDSLYVKYASSAKYSYLKNKLKKGMLNVVTYISKSFAQSEFRPLGFEIEFDNNKLFAPIEVKLENGHTMYLRGKIDRVDFAKIKEATYLRVVDYKSSGKDLKLSDVKEGVSLQLMTYMAALIENKDKISKDTTVLPAAVSYFTLNTDLLNLSECVSEDKISEKLIEKMKMKGIYLNDVEVLKSLDNKFGEPSKSYIEMTSRKLNNTTKSLIEEQFLDECKNMKNILRKIGDEVVEGHVKPSMKEESCKYCNYSGICKKHLKSV